MLVFKKLAEAEELLKELVVANFCEIKDISYFRTEEFLRPEQASRKKFSACKLGFKWERGRNKKDRKRAKADLPSGGISEDLALGTNCWFRLRFVIPEEMKGRPVWLKFRAKPLKAGKDPLGNPMAMEALCYKNGSPWQAFDNGRDELLLTECAKGGEKFDLLVEVGTTTLWGGLDFDEFVLSEAAIYSERPEVKRLYTLFRMLNGLRRASAKPVSKRIGKALEEAIEEFLPKPIGEDEIGKRAEKALEKLKSLTDLPKPKLGLIACGYSHLDLAWLWPWSESVRKGCRTFSSVIKLMEEHPEFRFVQSQPHLYEFVKSCCPDIFEKVRQRIEEGEWRPIGGTWVECDANLPSGEALVRQYILGKAYFMENFGIEPKITFLPDTFGFPPSLPQISLKAGCPYFLSQKLSWNDTNEFPHHTFRWKGIDGSEIFAHFLPANTYNGKATPEELLDTVRNFKESDVVDMPLYLFGIGDGGGGPTRQMLENLRTAKNLKGLPTIKQSSPKDFYKQVKWEKLPSWFGELYLERHRGTYTSQARIKKMNRRGELDLREAEFLSIAALIKNGLPYRKTDLLKAWKILLFNQFHDILAGTSIGEVYEDASRDYEKMFRIVKSVIKRAADSLFKRSEGSDIWQITNSLSWERSSIVELETNLEGSIKVQTDEGAIPAQREGNRVIFFATIPPLGTKGFELTRGKAKIKNEIKVSEKVLENSKLRIELDESGYIKSILDRDAGRQVIEGQANKLVIYKDKPMGWLEIKSDAWDLDKDLCKEGKVLPKPLKVQIIESGPVRGKLRHTREFGSSKLIQDIVIYKRSKRIDFETKVDWHESRKLLKVHFPIAVHATEATYETQFGHYTRLTHPNTSWDKAKFEVPHQKWVDVSEFGYGAAVLNDCKYGVSVDGSDIGLSLLRAPKFPDPQADQGEHEFTYSLLPHKGSFQEAGVIEQAYDLNVPLKAIPVEERVSWSLLKLSEPGVIVESLKKAEDRDEIALRLYEAWGRKVEVNLKAGFGIKRAWETNLLEDKEEEIDLKDNSFRLSFRPFEIKTIALQI